MAILSLLITLLVIAALYFGIRWIYNTVTDDTDSVDTQQIEGQVNVDEDRQNGFANAFNGGDSSDSEDDGDEGTVTDEAASTTRETSADATGAEDSTASVSGVNTNDDDTDTLVSTGATELPNTGANESIVILFIALTAAGYFTARKQFVK